MQLENRVALITGGARGIGLAIASKLKSEGARVVLLDINQEILDAAAERLSGAGIFYCDLADVSASQKVVEQVVTQYGGLDILVNNAGVSSNIPLEEMTPAEWDRVVNVNMRGTFFLTQAAFAVMKKARYGKLVFIASLSGERGGRFAGMHYSCSKGAIITMAKCFALSGGEFNITSNAIAPGLIATEMGKALNLTPTDVVLGQRLGTPEEVADAAFFLASEQSRYVTGFTLDVNGGIFMR